MVRLKRVYESPAPEDGRRILVDRLWPRGIKKDDARIGEWMKDVAPSTELRKWFSHDPAKWPEFKRRYKKELAEKSDLVKQLIDHARKGTITLLFAARDTEHANAALLKEVIDQSIVGLEESKSRQRKAQKQQHHLGPSIREQEI